MKALFRNIKFTAVLSLRLSINFADSLFIILAMVYAQDKPLWLTSVLVICSYLPELLLIFMGPVIDRYKAYPLLKYALSFQVVLLLFLLVNLVFFTVNDYLFIGVFLLSITLSGFTYPIEETVIPKIVADENLVPANALISIAHAVADALFNGISGVLLLGFSVLCLYRIDLVLFIIPLVILRTSKKHLINIEGDAAAERYTLKQYRRDFLNGINEMFQKKYLTIIIPLVIVNFFVAMTNVYFPHFVKLFTQDYASLYAGLEMMKGIGSVIGAAVIGRIIKNIRYRAGIALSFLVLAAGLLLAIFAHQSAVFLFWIVIAYIGYGSLNIMLASLFQLLIPHDILGRANTTIDTMIILAAPLGGFVAGLLPFTAQPRIVMAITPIVYVGMGCFFFAGRRMKEVD